MTLIDTTPFTDPRSAHAAPIAGLSLTEATQAAAAERPITIDLAERSVRELNAGLHACQAGSFVVASPAGQHNLAVGLTAPVEVTIDGHAGYYCAGMNQLATVRINGNVAVGVAENMMSGLVEVRGAAGQAAAASAHGGLLVVRGNAAARCGISLKGADIVVAGSVGHASAFMAQSGRLLVLGDAGEALGDSLYEARVYVRGAVASLGADCVEKPMSDEHFAEVAALLEAAEIFDCPPTDVRRYGSARELYHFTADRVEA